MELAMELISANWDQSTGRFELTFHHHTIDEAEIARQQILLHQVNLRELKREINSDIDDIRQQFQSRIDSVKPRKFVMVFGGKRHSLRDLVTQKRQIMTERDNLIGPYETVRANIDQLLLGLDGLKEDIDSFFEKSGC